MKYQIDKNNVISGIIFLEDIDVVVETNINFGLDKFIDGKILKASDSEIEDYLARQYELSKPSYVSLVEQYIREKYTVSQELAILRQRDDKPQEFAEYSAYCEQCKARAKEAAI